MQIYAPCDFIKEIYDFSKEISGFAAGINNSSEEINDCSVEINDYVEGINKKLIADVLLMLNIYARDRIYMQESVFCDTNGKFNSNGCIGLNMFWMNCVENIFFSSIHFV